VHHHGIGLGAREPGRAQAIGLEVLVGAGEQGPLHALVLDPQHDDHVGVRQALLGVVEDPDAQGLDGAGEQGLGAHHPDLADPQDVEGMDVGACHARVQDIADDGDHQVREPALDAPDREAVQEGLGRVLVAPVPGVDDPHPVGDVGGDQVGGAAHGMAHHEHVAVHRLQGPQGVEQGLTLLGAGGLDVEAQAVCGQAFGGQLEGRAGAGAGLEEQVGDGLAAQQRDLLDGPLAHPGEGLGGVQDGEQEGAREALYAQQVLEVAVPVGLDVARLHRARISPPG
jgi:hypothetical protein